MSFEEVTITVVYDSTYCKDRISRIENKCIEISYKEHPQKVQVYSCTMMRHLLM